MSKRRLLDLFCKAGGATRGYQEAGFHVTGVDHEPQPNYCGDEFILADALEVSLEGYDAIHAGPPCQAFTSMNNRHRGKGGKADSHLDLIAATRSRLLEAGVPYVLENVVGASSHLRSPLLLHGGLFGLGVQRARLFESNVLLLAPRAASVLEPIGVYGNAPDGRRLFDRADGSIQRAAASLEEGAVAMGISWMTLWDELKEAIPPAYTRYIGEQLRVHLEHVKGTEDNAVQGGRL